MKRREFLTTSALGTIALGTGGLSFAGPVGRPAGQNRNRKILLAGGGFGTTFIKYLASLTGKERPRLCYLPTASADRDSGSLRWYQNCAPLNVEPFVQASFISSYRMDQTFEEVLLSMDGIVVSGGNTLNQQAIWKAQGIDAVLREAWDRGIVLGGASAGSLCWFEEGTTDSRPKDLTKVECLGFLTGSHSPHYDGEPERRPTYQRMILFRTREGAKVYYVSAAAGEIVERELESEMIE